MSAEPAKSTHLYDVSRCHLGSERAQKAWALNEKVEAARPHAKIEAIFAIVAFPVMRPWYERF